MRIHIPVPSGERIWFWFPFTDVSSVDYLEPEPVDADEHLGPVVSRQLDLPHRFHEILSRNPSVCLPTLLRYPYAT